MQLWPGPVPQSVCKHGGRTAAGRRRSTKRLLVRFPTAALPGRARGLGDSRGPHGRPGHGTPGDQAWVPSLRRPCRACRAASPLWSSVSSSETRGVGLGVLTLLRGEGPGELSGSAAQGRFPVNGVSQQTSSLACFSLCPAHEGPGRLRVGAAAGPGPGSGGPEPNPRRPVGPRPLGLLHQGVWERNRWTPPWGPLASLPTWPHRGVSVVARGLSLGRLSCSVTCGRLNCRCHC